MANGSVLSNFFPIIQSNKHAKQNNTWRQGKPSQAKSCQAKPSQITVAVAPTVLPGADSPHLPDDEFMEQISNENTKISG